MISVVIVKAVSETSSDGPKRRIQVTCSPDVANPKDINVVNLSVRGQIISVEDHGLLVDLGLNRRGFLKYNDIEGHYDLTNNGRAVAADDDDGLMINHDDDTRYLNVNRIRDFIVKERSMNHQVLSLKLPKHEKICKIQSMTSLYKPTIQDLQPGMLVAALVELTVKNGICVRFGGNGIFRGAIEISHLDKYVRNNDDETTTSKFKSHRVTITKDKGKGEQPWKKYYMESGRSLVARIIAVDPVTRLVRLSLLPHIISMNVMPYIANFPPQGTIVERCQVLRIDDSSNGAFLTLPSENVHHDAHTDMESVTSKPMKHDEDTYEEEEEDSGSKLPKRETSAAVTSSIGDLVVYVHISKAFDDKKDDDNDKTPESVFHKMFTPGTQHTVRLLSMTHLIENIVTGATAKSFLEAHLLCHSDLIPGKLYKQVPVCKHIEETGAVVVDFGMGVKGLISVLHMFDHGSSLSSSSFRSKVSKVKFSIGAKVDVRVLYVDGVSKKCYLTAKKPLVKASPNAILRSYEEAKIGNKVIGFVSKVDKNGLWITFFNRVYGCVTARSLLTELGIENHIENYHVGDVVECRIVNIKKWNKQHRRSGSRRSRSSSEDNIQDNDMEGNDDDMDDDLSGTGSSKASTSTKSNVFRQLTLSLKLDVPENEMFDAAEGESQTTENTLSKKLKLRALTLLPAKSMRVKELVNGKQNDNGSFISGYAIVSVKTKHLFPNEIATTSSSLSTIECKLPYDQLLDEYEPEWVESAASLDEFASKALTVGKKINKKGIVVIDPVKVSSEYIAGTGRFIVISIRPTFVEYAEKEIDNASKNEKSDINKKKKAKQVAAIDEPFLPNPHSNKRLHVGANVVGYVNQIHKKHGAFIHFLNDMSGLVPKGKGGLLLSLYRTMIFKITAIDERNQNNRRISLEPAMVCKNIKGSPTPVIEEVAFQPGDVIDSAEIVKVDFEKAMLKMVKNTKTDDAREIRIRLHCTVAEKLSNHKIAATAIVVDSITSKHPFFGLEVGNVLHNVHIINVKSVDESLLLDVTNIADLSNERRSQFSFKPGDLQPGQNVTGIVSNISIRGGLVVVVNPLVKAVVPPLEISDEINVLENIGDNYGIGTQITGIVVDQTPWSKRKAKFLSSSIPKSRKHKICLSMLPKNTSTKPSKGDVVIGLINNDFPMHRSPALMLELRGGYVGRCCITEINDTDSWTNMPMERLKTIEVKNSNDQANGVVDENVNIEVDENDKDEDESNKTKTFRWKLAKCRVLDTDLPKAIVDVSLRPSRIDGDLSDDHVPGMGDIIQGYVVETNKKGCFMRFSRQTEGRAIIKEICDGFLPNPAISFPPGRLVVGKVKQMKSSNPNQHNPVANFLDIDMRESVLERQLGQITFENIQVGVKYKGVVERIEAFGVFVRIQNSDLLGLVHKSECSDDYVKNISALFQAGDLVKVLVLKADKESKRLSLSMKASHFEDDSISEDSEESDESNDGSEEESDMKHTGSATANKDASVVDGVGVESDDSHSDDEDSSEESDADSIESQSSESATVSLESDTKITNLAADDVDARPVSEKYGLDTNVGFEWEGQEKTRSNLDTVDESSDNSNSDSDNEGSDVDANGNQKSTRKSRKKQARRRREEEETLKREKSLADGTADANPETAADFERLLAGAPNSSELWIRYMAFHLSLADVTSARDVANRAIGRIEFRQEKEKLNIWCALLTLELKYGTESSVQETLDRASRHSNPKHVYLRTCEICSREALAGSPDFLQRADEMFAKMCKKFKDKKKVWISYFEYLVKTNRHEEAHALSKRALLSLPNYKKVEAMGKFAQLVFEFGKAEHARTLFDGLLQHHPKRLDLFFVYVDKEIKFGDVETARSLFQHVANPNDSRITLKLTDKQMKSFFKKWFSFEQEHGTDDNQENVKVAAREYVERITSVTRKS